MLQCLYSKLKACDVCGCSASGSAIGILPQFQKRFVGLVYQTQMFTSTHPLVAGETSPQSSRDHFSSITAWGRFYPLKRVQVFAFLPYHYNYVEEQGHTTVMQGIGDVRLLVNYMVFNTAGSVSASWKHTLLLGGGIKAPTGKNLFTNNEGIILSNMQPGTGSWDMLANANYTLRFRDFGLNADIIAQFPTVNQRDYLYGNKVNAGLSGFYWHRAERYSLLPQLGLRYQFAGEDLSSYEYNITNPYSGGYQLYATAGAGVYYGRFAVSALGYIPVAQHYAGGLVKAKPRLDIQLQFLF